MILFGNLLMGLGQVVGMVLNLVLLLVFVSVILSWLRLDPYHPVVNYIHTVAESLYRVPRKYFNTAVGQMDFAPVIILLVAYFLQTVLVNSLMEYGYQLKQDALMGSRRQQIQEVLPGAGKGKRL
jgi:YggT family protein